MPVLDQTSSVTRSWTGVETIFTTGMLALDAAHVIVKTAATTLVRDTHYTSELAVGTNFLVIRPLPAMPAAPQTLTIERNTPATQPDDPENGNTYDANAFEDQLNRVVLIAQELRPKAETALSLAVEAQLDAALALETINEFVSFNIPAGSITAAKLATGAAVGNIAAGTILAAMLATGVAAANLGYTPENLAAKNIAGGYAGLDGAGKVPRARIYVPETYGVTDTGADATGVANSATAFNNAGAAVGAKGSVWVPAGAYKLDANVTAQATWILTGDITLSGSGAAAGLPHKIIQFGSKLDPAANGHDFYVGPWSKWPGAWLTAITGRSHMFSSAISGASYWGSVGVFGASKASDTAAGAQQSAIGLHGLAVLDTSQGDTVYALYLDTVALSGSTGTAICSEGDIINLRGSVVQLAPNAPFAANGTMHTWIASGGAVGGAGTASLGIGIINNGANFRTGIMVAYDALTADGEALALSAAGNHQITAYNSSGNITGRVQFTATSTTNAAGLILDTYGALIQHVSGAATWMQVFGASTSVDGFLVRAAAAGTAVGLEAMGTSANVPLYLKPKGASSIFVGNAAVPTNLATNPGRVILTDIGGLASNAGLEIFSSTYAAGYGFKITANDEGSGVTPLIIGARQNSATWVNVLRIHTDGVLEFKVVSSLPAAPIEGMICYQGGKFKGRTASAWVDFH